MADLLLHSLAEFSELILSCFEIAGARRIIEVGSESGSMTRKLLGYASLREATLTVIDPVPSAKAESLITGHPRATLHKGLAIDVLPQLAGDVYLVDGDHNYYSVRHESEAIWSATQASNTPFLAFYHDVCWPWARRDLYYEPQRIPEDYRQPFTWDHGVAMGETGVVPGGFRGLGQWACAMNEGGPRNGVLTAIEDFAEDKQGRLIWACIPAIFGLGVLFDSKAEWAGLMQQFLLPYHMDPLLARLEKNRLECYLKVLEWQDSHACA